MAEMSKVLEEAKTIVVGFEGQVSQPARNLSADSVPSSFLATAELHEEKLKAVRQSIEDLYRNNNTPVAHETTVGDTDSESSWSRVLKSAY